MLLWLLVAPALASDDTFHPNGSHDVLSIAALQRAGQIVGRTGRILVHADDADAIARVPGVASVVRLRGGLLRVTPAPGVDDLALSRQLHDLSGVGYAMPDLLLPATVSTIPNDPLLPYEWDIENTGQNGGTPDIDINAEEAWATTNGAGQIIAVLDSGVQLDHPDLSVIPGYDYVSRDPDPSPDPNDWENPHGTCVSGVAAAVGDNGIGVAGVAWGAQIYAVRLIGGTSSSTEDLYNAFVDAVEAGAGVLSNSWGWSENCASIPPYGTFVDMANFAEDKGRGGLGSLVTFAAGNGNCDIENDGMLAQPTLVAVSATFTPSAHARAYSGGYAEYRKLYRKLKGLYHRLNSR